jgi:hypothetical protein
MSNKISNDNAYAQDKSCAYGGPEETPNLYLFSIIAAEDRCIKNVIVMSGVIVLLCK